MKPGGFRPTKTEVLTAAAVDVVVAGVAANDVVSGCPYQDVGVVGAGVVVAQAGLQSPDAGVRAAALGALERLGELSDDDLRQGLTDDDVGVRRRAAELAARHPHVDLVPSLADDDPRVVEVAAWACGEHE